MRSQLALALIVFGLSAFLTQTLSAAQVLVVDESSGKWAMEYAPRGDLNVLTAKAMAECRAKGGKNPKVVWYTYFYMWKTHEAAAHGAIAISDNGAGTILGWSVNKPPTDAMRAREDCRRKGGQNPKVVDSW